MRKIVVTGASSFIGVHLIKELMRSANTEVYAVVRPRSSNMWRLPQAPNLNIIELDMNRIGHLPEKIDGEIDAFYHLAWEGTRAPYRDDSELQKNNMECSMEAAKAAIHLHTKMFLGSGSQAEYGKVTGRICEADEAHPVTAYGVMKSNTYKQLEPIFKKNNIRFYWVRIFSVFGTYDYSKTLIMSSIEKMKKNETLELTECIQDWDYVYIKDVANALRLFSEKNADSGIYNIASGNVRKLRDFVMELKEILHSDSEIRFGAVPYGPEGVVNLCPIVDKIQNQLGWKAETGFSKGIKEMLNK